MSGETARTIAEVVISYYNIILALSCGVSGKQLHPRYPSLYSNQAPPEYKPELSQTA